jgi:hypothetical protein
VIPRSGHGLFLSELINFRFLTFFCEMQHLVTELKRDRDEDFQNSIDELASELNRVSMTACIFFKAGLQAY